MPTPKRTTISIVDTVLSMCSPNALLNDAMSPSATWDTTPITSTGRRAITGLLKMRRSSTRISPTVAIATTLDAVWPDFCWSTTVAALPVTPARRSEPLVSEETTPRIVRIASVWAVVSCPSAFGIWTPITPTRRFAETAAGSTMPTAARCRDTRSPLARSSRAVSPGESARPSLRATTTRAAGMASLGNARFWRFDAWTDW